MMAICRFRRITKMRQFKFKIIYLIRGKEEETVLTAFSKYDAKKRFFRENDEAEIIRIEEVRI